MKKKSDYHISLLNGVDWTLVANCLYQTENQKLNREQWIEKEQQIMSKRIKLIIDVGITELRCENWLFTFNMVNFEKNEFYFRMMFIPLDNTINVHNRFIIQDLTYEKNVEWKTLHELLGISSKKEEFEKCQLIKNRIL